MKKILIAGGIVVLGIAAFLFNSGTTTNNSASASTKDKVVLFGKVDFSDDDDKDTDVSLSKKDDDHEESWLEQFILVLRFIYQQPIQTIKLF